MNAKDKPTIHVVDDDASVRESLVRLLRRLGLNCQSYPSAEEFLDEFSPQLPGCLILDLRMPGMDGNALHRRLQDIDARFPVIFLTGHATVQDAVDAMRLGAVHFLEKPIEPQALLSVINQALAVDQKRREDAQQSAQLAERCATLSPREREVLALLLEGKTSAQIAEKLFITPGTAKLHRAHLMKKMGVNSANELIRSMIDARRNGNEIQPVSPSTSRSSEAQAARLPKA